MNTETLKTLLDCTIEEAEKFNTILEFCKKFDKNALNNAIDLTHQYNYSICLDNVLKFIIVDLIDNLVDTIYKDTNNLLSIDDFTIVIDTDNILSYDDTILLSYEDENKDVIKWLEDNCKGFVEY